MYILYVMLFFTFLTITSVQHLKMRLSYQNSHRGENFAWRGRNVYVLLTIHETHRDKPINIVVTTKRFNEELVVLIPLLYYAEQTC